MRNVNSLQSSAARRCGAILVFAALLAACQHKSPEQELLDKADAVGSWIATLQMAGEKWLANSVPKSFVKSTCKEADRDLDQATGETAKSQARPEVRDPLRQLISQTRAAGASLRRAVATNDRPGAAREAGRLAALGRQLAAWKKGAGSS
ncbi:MAG TPA: hypothetical protein VIA62_02720 [Thermoanaerobaculia bacterium]|jgi:hypothetical protein|nr:hypothetical protein [Thermoanaerobaculia bacterium]